MLVHGAWHGPWCWDKLAAVLRDAGHEVSVVDLQGTPTGGRAPVESSTLSSYTDRVVQALDAQASPVILVAPSSGGLAASQAAESRPKKVRTLAFLSAFVAADGEAHRNLTGADPGQKVSPVLLVDFRPATRIPLQTRIDVSKPAEVKLAFYNDCSDQDAQAMMKRLVPEPAGPAGQPLRLTAANFGSVAKVYIHCALDNAISLARQRQFAAKWPMRKTVTLEAGHSPFISMPARLAAELTAL
ncbi:alpha/beta fold hydrolase [Pigmentiphaga daeguensis]|uniref:Alpha/beta fold hydrolase n=1 Tax=Pigmentiphaga daeguensis TaxID=414049 RepID=A0ABN1D652_9BURK